MIRVTAQATPDNLVVVCEVSHKFDPVGDSRQFASCFILTNGLGGPTKFPLVSGWGGPYPPHAVSRTTVGRVITETYTIVRSADTFLVPPGPVELHVEAFDLGSHPLAFARMSVVMP